MIDWQDIYDAYRKLKAYVYYDSSGLFLREEIASFEAKKFKFKKNSNQTFEEIFKKVFKNLYYLLNPPTEKKNRGKSKEILAYNDACKEWENWLNKLECKPILKKLSHNKTREESPLFITNFTPKTDVTVEKYNCIIDAPIEIHVLSVIWLMKVGVLLSKYISNDNYAYRLCTTTCGVASKDGLSDEEVSVKTASELKIQDGLGLYLPYFSGYKAWRDNGLDKAIRELDENRPVILLSLDITGYYYHIRLNVWDTVKKAIELNNLTLEVVNLAETISNRIQEVHNAYAEKLQAFPDLETNVEKQGFCPLPIGLLSSGILANVYLKDFDDNIRENISPAYYGRYVDDILMIFSGKTIDFKELEETNKELTEEKKISPVDWFINKHLLDKPLLKRDSTINGEENIPLGAMTSENKGKIVYYIQAPNAKMSIQSDKVIMEYFQPYESRAVINKFRKKLEESSSEFRLLPFESRIDDEFDNEAFHLEYNDSINKLRSIRSISEDRFGASKFLAQKIFLSILPFSPDEKEKVYQKQSSQQILSLFKGVNTLRFNSLWEKVATYFLVNRDIQSLIKFYRQSIEAIDLMKPMDEDGENEKVMSETTLKALQINVKKSLIIALGMAFALDPSQLAKVRGRINKESVSEIKKIATDFRKSYLFRHQYQYIKGLCYTFTQEELEGDKSLLGRDIMTAKVGELNTAPASYLSPVFLKLEDIAMLTLLNKMGSR